jgi:hypothetical protein
MAREELKWQNIDADDLPAAVKKSFDAMVEAERSSSAFRLPLSEVSLARIWGLGARRVGKFTVVVSMPTTPNGYRHIRSRLAATSGVAPVFFASPFGV